MDSLWRAITYAGYSLAHLAGKAHINHLFDVACLRFSPVRWIHFHGLSPVSRLCTNRGQRANAGGDSYSDPGNSTSMADSASLRGDRCAVLRLVSKYLNKRYQYATIWLNHAAQPKLAAVGIKWRKRHYAWQCAAADGADKAQERS